MTPQELKNSILQLAIQGKLVEQIKDEEEIQIITSFSGNTEDLFDLPDNWKWVALKDIVSIETGLSFKKEQQRTSENGDLRILRGGNIGDDFRYHLFDDDIYVESNQFTKKYIPLKSGDVITPSVTSMEKICKTGYVDIDLQRITAGGFVYIIRCLDKTKIDSKFLLYFFSSTFNKEQCKPNIHKSGQAFYNLKKSGLIEQPICLPPLAEQKRIVAKIEELLPYIDRYEAAWTKLEDFNKRFPVDMQKSILQYAIQGKLVEQRPEEGTGEDLYQQIQKEKQRLIKEGKIKKEKPLPKITEDEIPFDIPESWKWVRLGSLAELITKGSSPSWQGIKYVDKGLLFVTSENVGVEQLLLANPKYLEEKFNEIQERSVLKKGDILTNIVGASIGRTAIYDRDELANINQAVCLIRLVDKRLNVYITKYLNSYVAYRIMMNDKVDTARANISLTNISDFIVPLPPLAEQKRIVAKLEEILPLCEKLKK